MHEALPEKSSLTTRSFLLLIYLVMMSAFSRGLLLRAQCLRSSRQCFSTRFGSSKIPTIRFLSSSKVFRYVAKNMNSPSSRTVNIPTKIVTQSSAKYQSFADSLASKSHSTLLYTAPPHSFYMISSYTAAFFCFSYAAYNFNAHYLSAPPDLAPWVPVAFGGVCFLVASFGGWLVLGPARLIRTITAVPLPKTLTQGSRAQGPLAIEVELRKMFPLPFFPARKITASQEDMTLNHRLYVPPVDVRQSAAERLKLRRKMEREQEEERAKSIWAAPFRHANKAFYDMFRSMSRVWTREGFLQLNIKGQAYKLDVSGGWALDEGKAIDRLVKLKL